MLNILPSDYTSEGKIFLSVKNITKNERSWDWKDSCFRSLIAALFS